MSIARRIANLFRRSEVDCEIDAELRSHIEMRTEDNIAAGMTREQARRDSLLRFGNRTSTRERVAGADAALLIESIGLSRFGYSLSECRIVDDLLEPTNG